jgi:hypothetical protein
MSQRSLQLARGERYLLAAGSHLLIHFLDFALRQEATIRTAKARGKKQLIRRNLTWISERVSKSFLRTAGSSALSAFW